MMFVGAGGGSILPSDVAGLVGWWDASDTATISNVSGGCSQWNDKSGSGFHATQGTAGSRPATGSRTQNGLNVLDFDGSADNLTCGDVLDIGATSMTWLAVVKFDNTSSQRTVFQKAATGTTDGRFFLLWETSPDNGIMPTYDYGSPPGTFNYKPSPTTDPVIIMWRVTRNGASSEQKLWVNGTLRDTETYTDPGTTWNIGNSLTFGGAFPTLGYYLDGWIGELARWNAAVSDGDVTALNAYASAKWGIV